jgi:hypothetical protein
LPDPAPGRTLVRVQAERKQLPMTKRYKGPNWDNVEKLVRLATQLATLFELVRKLL